MVDATKGQCTSSLDVQEAPAMNKTSIPHSPLIWNALRGALALALIGVMGGVQAMGDPKGGDKGAKPVATNETYIEQWQDEAVQQMERYGIPASITLAQGILESGNGVSELAQKSNNHFGIKCHATWTGKRTYHDDEQKANASGCTTTPKTATTTTASSCCGIGTRGCLTSN